MTEPGDISDLVYADRYAWPGESLRIDTYRRVAIALAAREAGPERNATPPSSWKISRRRDRRGAHHGHAGAADGDGDGGATMVNCFVQPAIDPGLAGRKAWMRRWPAPCARCPWAVVSAMTSALCRPRTQARSGRRMRRHRPLRPGLPGPCHAGQAPAGRADGRAGLRSSRPARLPRQGRTAPLADPEPVGRAERPLPAGRGERRGVDPAPCLPAGGRTGITARRAWRRWNLALCRLGAAAVEALTAAACRDAEPGCCSWTRSMR